MAADLTPKRLAAFYRQVGGNYDQLFLQTKSQALSFIYQSLGCFHSLQPSGSPYYPPSVPSLLPNGFVRWQTIQILMDPGENWQYLQNALKIWDITDSQGNSFPKELPREALPSEPDPEMLQWHEEVSKRLMQDYEKRIDYERRKSHPAPHSPPNFDAWRHGFGAKESQPEDEEYASPPPRPSHARHQSYADPDRGSRRAHRRRLSAEYPAFSSRRPESGFIPRADGGRSGMTSPRTTSPAPRPDRPPRSRGRQRASWYGPPFSPEAESDAQEADEDDLSDDTILEEDPEPRPRHRHRRRNLSPPSSSHARRHSHDAYKRKPARQISPDPHHRSSRRSQDLPPPKPKKSHSTSARRTPPEERSGSRPRTSLPSGTKFKEHSFDVPSPPPGPYSPRMAPRTRYNMEPYDEIRRASHSSGSMNGSRPGSGSSSERTRPYGNPGFSPRTARFMPSNLAEDAGYHTSRRAPIYD